MDIKQNLAEFTGRLPGNCRLIAVSKTHPPEAVLEAYHAGQRLFGENKVQELVNKYEQLPKDIQWHLIGHLQSNKVKYIAPFVSLIHSVDSLTLLKEINKQGLKHNRQIDCLLQIHIAAEDTKFGLSYEEAEILLQSEEVSVMKNVRIIGLMGMATNTENCERVKAEFHQLKAFFDTAREAYKADNIDLKELSMGMSSDFHVAIEEGSTLIRVGSAIFGKRDYSK